MNWRKQGRKDGLRGHPASCNSKSTYSLQEYAAGYLPAIEEFKSRSAGMTRRKVDERRFLLVPAEGDIDECEGLTRRQIIDMLSAELAEEAEKVTGNLKGAT